MSEETIEQARAGVYPGTIAANLTPERLRRFFVPFDGGHGVNKLLRDRCVFARQDVTLDPPFSKLDLIVCRNLLIYLTQATQKKVISVFHYALKPEGVLMLGRSETIGGSVDLFGLVDKRFQIYGRKPGRVREIAFGPISPIEPRTQQTKEPALRSLRMRGSEWDAQTDANRLMLDRYAPPAVIVDGDLRIVRSRGSTRPYLELPTGDVTFDILKMVRPELLFGLRAALQEARTRGRAAVREGIRFKSEGKARAVDLYVIPIGGGDSRQFLILFEEGQAGERARARGRATKEAGPPARGRHAARQLQEELSETRRQLQAIIDDLGAANEELQSANEEILSSNEELQSTNEELDTAKEELQSTNEELSTLNDELHGRNDELSRVNSDLMNLLDSVQIPIVMVSRDLKIRRFTPAAERTLNIIPSDVGRPIGHLKPNLIAPDLEALIGEVIDTVTIRDREVQGHNGRKYALQIRPYKSIENRIDGAVLALFDLSASGNHQGSAGMARDTLEALIGGVPEPMVVLDRELRVVASNPMFRDKFGLGPSEIEGRSLIDIDHGAWNSPSFRTVLGDVLVEQKNVEGLLLEQDFDRIGRRKLHVDARPLHLEGGNGVLLILRDLTAQGST